MTTSARVSPHPAASFPIRAAQLVRGNTGWVLTTGALSMTSNGGQTWTAVTPPGVPAGAIMGVYFQNTTNGWVVSSSASNHAQLAISATTDSGSSWSTWSAGHPDPGFADTDSAHVDFVDKQHGWVVVTLPGSPQRCCPGDEPGTLRGELATTDDLRRIPCPVRIGAWAMYHAGQLTLSLVTRRAPRPDQGCNDHFGRPATSPSRPGGRAARPARRPGSAMTVAESGDVPGRPVQATETSAARALVPVPADRDADCAVTALYAAHYRSLVRLAALLVGDVATAEEVVQESFVAMHSGWRRLRDSDKALCYLRQSVVNRSRSVLRHRVVVDRHAPRPLPDMPSAEQGAIALLERSAVIAALRTLPPRQRQALVLRYYGDLSEAHIAAAMGISRGAVKSHTARAMSSLRAVLEREA